MLIKDIVSIEPFDWHSVGVALLCGFIIGFERQLRGKPVGIRTASLITLGTYFFIATSMYLQNDVTDPSRIIGQVITGIGFLGAGVMLSRCWGSLRRPLSGCWQPSVSASRPAFPKPP